MKLLTKTILYINLCLVHFSVPAFAIQNVDSVLEFCEVKELSQDDCLALIGAYTEIQTEISDDKKNQASENQEEGKDQIAQDDNESNFVDLDILLQKLRNKNKSFSRLKDLNLSKKELIGAGLVIVSTAVISVVIGLKINPKYHLQNISPRWALRLGQAIMLPAAKINRILPSSLAVLVSAPIGEEIMTRGVVQEGVLRRLPKYLMKKIGFKEKTVDKVVDHPVAAVARTVLVAWLFAIGHYMEPSSSSALTSSDVQSKAGFYPQFIVGLMLGAIKETTDSLYPAMAAHAVYNGSMMAIGPLLGAVL